MSRVLREEYDLDVNDEDEATTYGEENTIEIECSPFGARQLIPLLKQLEYMGNVGASRRIKIDNYETDETFSFDGDGSAKIGGIYLNGEEVN